MSNEQPQSFAQPLQEMLRGFKLEEVESLRNDSEWGTPSLFKDRDSVLSFDSK
jgi:hypothetical protein